MLAASIVATLVIIQTSVVYENKTLGAKDIFFVF